MESDASCSESGSSLKTKYCPKDKGKLAMAKDSKTRNASNLKGKKMATSNVNASPVIVLPNDPENPSIIKKSATRKVKHPITGKNIERKGEYVLPAAHGKDLQTALILCGMDESEVIFWFNQGRMSAARAQLNAALEFDLGSEDLNQLFDQFKSAMSDILPKNADEARIKRVKDFILGEDKFKPLIEVLDKLEKEGLDEIKITFGTPDSEGKIAEGELELKKPTGVRGKPRKVVAGETPATETPDESDSEGETETEE